MLAGDKLNVYHPQFFSANFKICNLLYYFWGIYKSTLLPLIVLLSNRNRISFALALKFTIVLIFYPFEIMKQIICLVFFIIGLGTMNAQNFNRISKEILKGQNSLYGYWDYNNYYADFRQRTEMLGKVYNNQKKDTLYLLQLHSDMSDEYLYSAVWNKSDTICYEVADLGKNSIDVIPKYSVFSRQTYVLVSEWDKEKIKREADITPEALPPMSIFATRIIIDRKKYYIDCFNFRNLFVLGRDSYDIFLP